MNVTFHHLYTRIQVLLLIESGFLNKPVIAADSNTGPSEILNNSNNGFLFKNNDKISLVNQYLKFKKLSGQRSNE